MDSQGERCKADVKRVSSSSHTACAGQSIARDDATGVYLMAAAFQALVYTFTARDVTLPAAFVPTTPHSVTGNFGERDTFFRY